MATGRTRFVSRGAESTLEQLALREGDSFLLGGAVVYCCSEKLVEGGVSADGIELPA